MSDKVRRWFLPVFLGFCLIEAANAQETPQVNPFYGKSYALVVGINDYSQAGSDWQSLNYARGDAEAVGRMLTNLGFDVIELYDKEGTRANILNALETLILDKLNPNDRVVFFFSGHGETRQIGDQDYGYLVPYDGTSFPNYVSMEDLQKSAEFIGLKARHQLFIVDACYGGLLGAARTRINLNENTSPTHLLDLTARRAKHILTAGDKDQRVVDFGPNGHSVFTNALLEGVERGNADSYRDGFITFSELYNYVVTAATTNNQTPGYDVFPGHRQGEFLFRSPHAPEADKVRVVELGDGATRSRGNQPSIELFAATPFKIQVGESTRLAWESSNADCRIDGIDHANGQLGNISIAPASTTTYTLRCSAGGAEATSNVTVEVVSPVRITSFSSDKFEVARDERVALSWSADNATACRIEPLVGDVESRGSTTVGVSSSRQFNLTCRGETGTTSRSINIAVRSPEVVIRRFEVDNEQPLKGALVQLSWSTVGADYCLLGSNRERVNATGFKSVRVDRRSSFELACYSGWGTSTQESLVVDPVAPVEVTSFSANKGQISSGESVRLSWKSRAADRCEIDPAIGDVNASGSTLQYPWNSVDSDITYRLTCYGNGGTASRQLSVDFEHGFAAGTITIPCGCHGFVTFGSTRPNPNCQSGQEQAQGCGWACPTGGFAWGARCL